jgi:hypothetical protein
LGEPDPQEQLWSYQVNLDKRVRSDHPLPRINQTLDLDFVRQEGLQNFMVQKATFQKIQSLS